MLDENKYELHKTIETNHSVIYVYKPKGNPTTEERLAAKHRFYKQMAEAFYSDTGYLVKKEGFQC